MCTSGPCGIFQYVLLCIDFRPSLLTVHWCVCVSNPLCDPPCLIAMLLHTDKTAQTDCEPLRQQPTTHLASIWGHSNLLGHVLLSVGCSLEKTLSNYKPQSHRSPGRMLPFYSWSTNTSSSWQLPPLWLPHPHTHPPSYTHAYTAGKGRVQVNSRSFYVLRLLEI